MVRHVGQSELTFVVMQGHAFGGQMTSPRLEPMTSQFVWKRMSCC